jgi:hypothetical protein
MSDDCTGISIFTEWIENKQILNWFELNDNSSCEFDQNCTYSAVFKPKLTEDNIGSGCSRPSATTSSYSSALETVLQFKNYIMFYLF